MSRVRPRDLTLVAVVGLVAGIALATAGASELAAALAGAAFVLAITARVLTRASGRR